MINGWMNQSEILKEIWKDYHETIKPSCFRVIEKNKKDLLEIQKRRPGEWIRMKKLVETRSKRKNRYNTILWTQVSKKNPVAIKTSTWFSYLNNNGKRRIVLFPSEENISALTLFSPKFFNEFREQFEIEKTDVDLEKQFFLEAEGNYTICHKDSQAVAIWENLGFGIGTFKDPGSYLFWHFIGKSKTKEMKATIGKDISDPLELWNLYYKKPEIIQEEKKIDILEEENLDSIFDEIAEKYG